MNEETKQKIEHSPLPWIASYGERLSDGSECRVIDCEEGSIAEMMSPKDIEDANAEFIVRAVNNHDALVRSLGDILQCFANGSVPHNDIIQSARAAFSAAQEQS